MKTNTIHVILTSVLLGVIAMVATSKTAVNLNVLTALVSYTAVALIAAVAVVDYRKNLKGYTAH